MTTTITDRTTRLEARFVEEGHYAVLDHDEIGAHIRIVSETLGHRGIAYKVRAATAGPGQPLVFTCAPDGAVGHDGHPEQTSIDGRPTCKHMAGAARRLHREGYALPLLPGVHGAIATRDTRWITSTAVRPPLVLVPAPQSDAYRAAAEGPGGDPFGGF
jgi:hypothetical protein